jgi:hypothetical protein
MFLLSLLACTGTADLDSASGVDTGESVGDTCPGMDCQDAFTGYVINAIGTPVAAFRVLAAMDNGEDAQFDCPGAEDAIGLCLEDAFVLRSRFGTASITLTDDEAERWVGEITPEWADAVGRIEECGAYCDVASAEFRLE